MKKQQQQPFSLLFPQTLLLSILILIMISIQPTSSQNLINSTCKTCVQYDPTIINFNFCTTSLQSAPASQCASLQALATISIQLIRYNITDTRCHIKQLLQNNKKLDPYYKQCLSDCSYLYSDAIPSIKLAMTNYKTKRFADANVQISSIMDASTTCEDGFQERTGVVLLSPLTKRNKDIFQLSALALSIMRITQKTGSG